MTKPRIKAKVQPEVRKYFGPNIDCPKCGAPPKRQELREYDLIWGDGKVYCLDCNGFVRYWDRD